MKRILFAAPAVLLLASCSSSPAAVSVPDAPFSAEARVSYSGVEFTAGIKRISAGKWEFTLAEPYPLEGLTMSLCGGDTRLSMLGLEASADVAEGAVSAARAIAAAYDAAVTSPAPFTSTDSGYTMSGSCELGSFTVILGSDGNPAAFSCDPAGLSVELSGFSPLPKSEIEAEIVE